MCERMIVSGKVSFLIGVLSILGTLRIDAQIYTTDGMVKFQQYGPTSIEVNAGREKYYTPEEAEYFSLESKIPFKPKDLWAVKPIGLHEDGSVDYLFEREPYKKRKRSPFIFSFDENLKVKHVVRTPIIRGEHMLTPIHWLGQESDYLFLDPVGKVAKQAKIGLGTFTRKGRFDDIDWMYNIKTPGKGRKLTYTDIIETEDLSGKMAVTHFFPMHNVQVYEKFMELLLTFLPRKGEVAFCKRVTIPRLIKNFTIADYHLENDGGLYLLVEHQDYKAGFAYRDKKKDIKKKNKGKKKRKKKRALRKETIVEPLIGMDLGVSKKNRKRLDGKNIWDYSVVYLHPDSTEIDFVDVGLRKSVSSIRMIVDSNEIVLVGNYGTWTKGEQSNRFLFAANKSDLESWDKSEVDLEHLFFRDRRLTKDTVESGNGLPLLLEVAEKDSEGVWVGGQAGIRTLPHYYAKRDYYFARKDQELHHNKPHAFKHLPYNFRDDLYARGKKKVRLFHRLTLKNDYYNFEKSKTLFGKKRKGNHFDQFVFQSDFATGISEQSIEGWIKKRESEITSSEDRVKNLPVWVPMRSKVEFNEGDRIIKTYKNWFSSNKPRSLNNPAGLLDQVKTSTDANGNVTTTVTPTVKRNFNGLVVTPAVEERVFFGKLDSTGHFDESSMVIFNHDTRKGGTGLGGIFYIPQIYLAWNVLLFPLTIPVRILQHKMGARMTALADQYVGTKMQRLSDGRMVVVYNENGKTPNKGIAAKTLGNPKKIHTQIRIYSPEGELERYMYVPLAKELGWAPRMKDVFITEEGIYTWVFPHYRGKPTEFTRVFIPFESENKDVVGIAPTEEELEWLQDTQEQEWDEDAYDEDSFASDEDEEEEADEEDEEIDIKAELKKAKKEQKAAKKAQKAGR